MRRVIAILIVVLIGVLSLGAVIHDRICPPISEVVTETYVVQKGDTLWDIAVRYQARDCRNIYLPEFKSEIEERNPFLHERRGLIRPGDNIIIEYMIRK